MIKILGDLKRRINLNKERILSSDYTYPKIYTESSNWPGDYPGRTLLALTSLYNALEGDDESKTRLLDRMNKIFDSFKDHINVFSYFGEPFNNEFVDEQQVSGNSWYIRGLVEYYKITKNNNCFKYLNNIIDNFLLPIAPYYQNYPQEIRVEGGVSGNSIGSIINKWKVSSDVGCAFIMLDGYTILYKELKDERLKKAIESIIDKFISMPYMKFNCQTHATMTCCRAIIRFYEMTKDEKYLTFAKEIYDNYINYGMNNDYSNINWFNRPETWSEPCCIVDSLIASKKLYLFTKNTAYLNYFNKIYLNTIRTFQRDNGGAGCSTCAYKNEGLIKPFMYEAYFCCSMRLANGFSYVKNFAVLKQNNEYIVPFNAHILYEDEDVAFEINNEIYFNNSNQYSLKIIKPCKGKFLKIRTLEKCFETFYLDKKQEITKQVEISIHKEDNALFFGEMILTKKDKHDDKIFAYNNANYSYIRDNSKYNEQELMELKEYVK